MRKVAIMPKWVKSVTITFKMMIIIAIFVIVTHYDFSHIETHIIST